MNFYPFLQSVCIPMGYSLLFSFIWTTLCAQTAAPGPYKTLSTIRNVMAQDTITGAGLNISMTNPFPKNGRVVVQTIGSGSDPVKNCIQYLPNLNFTGTDTFALALNSAISYPFLSYQIYRVTVRPSLIMAQPDYAVTAIGQPVTINPLENDQTTTFGGLTLRTIPAVNYGTAVIKNANQILFTPAAGFTGIAHLNYTACDNLNTCQTGQIMIGVSSGPPANDTLSVSTAKNSRIFMPLPRSGYRIFTAPSNGVASMPNSYSFHYKPNPNFVGSDLLVLATGTGSNTRYKTVQIRVFHAPVANMIAIDDESATPVNQPVTLNVKNNDIGNLSVNSWIAPPVSQGSISNTTPAGKVTFTPATGFSGVATFGYVLGNNYIPNLETGSVQVAVGNQEPLAKTFNLTTPSDVPLVIHYKLPFNNFNFSITSSAKRGTVSYYPGQTTQTINGQSVSGYNLLVYAPAPGYIGTDSFSIKYCISPNGTCTLPIRLIVSVIKTPTGATPCLTNCVWPGDANGDGIANNKDLLTLGYALGTEGPSRITGNPLWYKQNSDPWIDPYTEVKTELKYADSDGNGRINSTDTSAISQYYGRTHTLQPLVYTLGNGLPFSLRNLTPNPKKGDKVKIEVTLGTEDNPVVNLRGFTFDVSLSSHIRDSALRMEYYPNNWLNMNAPVLWMQKNPTRGRLETAMIRTGDLLGHGYGVIGRFEFIVIDIIDGGKPGSEMPYFTVTIDQPTWMTAGNRSETGPSRILKIPLAIPSANSNPTTTAAIVAYPSPASNRLHLELSDKSNMEDVRITDFSGKTVYTLPDSRLPHLDISTELWPVGFYFIAAKTKDGWANKKIEVVR